MIAHATPAAADVAACIARHARDRGQAAGLDDQKVHNLLFLCQGYSLAAHGVPLFAGGLRAAPGGVLCPAANGPTEGASAGDVPDEVREVVARVWAAAGGLSAEKLRLRVGRHVECVRELAGGGDDLSGSDEALGRAFALAVQQGLV